jgi:hypothetical protein
MRLSPETNSREGFPLEDEERNGIEAVSRRLVPDDDDEMN